MPGRPEIGGTGIAFLASCALLHASWFLWDISPYAWHFDMRLTDFQPLAMPGHLHDIMGRWKYLTAWTNDLAVVQLTDALLAACRRRPPRQTLQGLTLLMASTVALGNVGGPPWRWRGSDPGDNLLFQLVGEAWYNILGVAWNCWVHGALAIVLLVQVHLFGGVQVGLVRPGPRSSALLFLLAWMAFSETFVRVYSSRGDDGRINFPYGRFMQMPLRPLFYLLLIGIAWSFAWVYARLGLLVPQLAAPQAPEAVELEGPELEAAVTQELSPGRAKAYLGGGQQGTTTPCFPNS